MVIIFLYDILKICVNIVIIIGVVIFKYFNKLVYPFLKICLIIIWLDIFCCFEFPLAVSSRIRGRFSRLCGISLGLYFRILAPNLNNFNPPISQSSSRAQLLLWTTHLQGSKSGNKFLAPNVGP